MENSQDSQVIVPLIVGDSHKFTNVLLIDSSVRDYQKLVDSTNSNTLSVVYFSRSTKMELLGLLRNKFNNSNTINRIGLAFDVFLDGTSNMFLNMNPLFIDNEVTPFSESVQFMIHILKEFNVKNIDFLGCNTLNYSNWMHYYNILTENTGVIVGASNNETGNIKYGGDWVMESTSESIESIYFKQSIEYYKYLLDSSFKKASVISNGNLYSKEINIPTTDASASTYLKSVGFTSTNTTLTQPTITVDGSSNLVLNKIFGVDVSFNLDLSSNSTGTYSYTVDPSGIATVSSTGEVLIIGVGQTTITITQEASGNYLQGITNVSLTVSNDPNAELIGGIYYYLNITTDPDTNIEIYEASVASNSSYLGSTSITIPSDVSLNNQQFLVTSIGGSAFYNCTSLTSIIISDSVTSIGETAFAGCTSLRSIIIPDSVTSIGEGVFAGCTSLTSIIIPDLVTSIGKNVFNSCTSLTSITIPNSVTSIGERAFAYCTSLRSIIIPNSVTSIGESVFYYCTSLASITIPNSVTTIGVSVFYYCISLTSITIPNSVESIGHYAFNACTNLNNVNIPDSVKSIGGAAFYYCSALNIVYFDVSETLPLASNLFNLSIFDFDGGDSDGGIPVDNPNRTIGRRSNNSIDFDSRNQLPLSKTLTTTTSYNTTAYYSEGVTTPDGSTVVDYLTYTLGFTSAIPHTRQQQTITGFSSTITKTTTSSAFSLDASCSSNLPLTYASSNIGVVTVDENGEVTIHDKGISTIIVTQNGNHTYAPVVSSTTVTVSESILVSNICFPAGTLIQTNQGTIPIEKIDPKLHTIRNKKICHITRTICQDKYLVCIEKNALGNNIPSEKTIISKNHRIWYNGKMMPAKYFVDKFEKVKKVKYHGEVLYNVLMEEADKMMVNNLICETLDPENIIAKVYNLTESNSKEEKRYIINKLNEYAIKNKIYK